MMYLPKVLGMGTQLAGVCYVGCEESRFNHKQDLSCRIARRLEVETAERSTPCRNEFPPVAGMLAGRSRIRAN